MRTFVLLILLFICACFKALGKYSDTIPPVIYHLLQHKGEIPFISTKDLKGLIPLRLLAKQHHQQENFLIKTKNRLLVGVNGTGMLFEIKDSLGYITFTRIDKTHHYGNNYGALNFTLNDTIYSLGGYGFWRFNGQLRYFNHQSCEWSLMKLNREITFANPTGWFDHKNRQLYVYGTHTKNQVLKTEEPQERVSKNKELYRLDISSGNWTYVGNLITIFDEAADNISSYNELLGDIHFNAFGFGHFIRIGMEHIYYDDFRLNRRWRAYPYFYKQFEEQIARVPNIFYCIDTTVYVSNIELHQFDSIPISKEFFYQTNEAVFTAVKKEKQAIDWRPVSWLLSGTLFGFLFVAGFSKIKHSRQNSRSVIINPIHPYNEQDRLGRTALFDEIESELIGFILSKCKHHQTASVVEVNKILGLSEKNEAVQKKNRSEKMNRINDKWRQATASKSDLLLRKRAVFDKRVIEYYISPQLLSNVDAFL